LATENNGLKAALFDFDGTLVNSEKIHMDSWNLALEKYGAAIDERFYSIHCAGNGTPKIAERIKKEFPAVGASVPELAGEKDAIYEQAIASQAVPGMPGVREILMFLAERKISIGLVTGAPLGGIQKTLDDLDIGHFFQVVVTRESVARGKPAPDGYLAALDRLGIGGSEAVSFEDTQSGVRASRAAGIKSFAIPQKYTAGHDFSAADVVCSDMFEARDILFKMMG